VQPDDTPYSAQISVLTARTVECIRATIAVIESEGNGRTRFAQLEWERQQATAELARAMRVGGQPDDAITAAIVTVEERAEQLVREESPEGYGTWDGRKLRGSVGLTKTIADRLAATAARSASDVLLLRTIAPEGTFDQWVATPEPTINPPEGGRPLQLKKTPGSGQRSGR